MTATLEIIGRARCVGCDAETTVNVEAWSDDQSYLELYEGMIDLLSGQDWEVKHGEAICPECAESAIYEEQT